MAPPAKKIEQALVKGTKDVYREDPETITVNKVRQHVAEDLELDDEFFSEAQWKAKSKDIIKGTMDKLLEDAESEEEPTKKPKKGTKRQSPEVGKPAPKRQRKEKKQEADEDADDKPSPSPEVKQTVEKTDAEDDADDAKSEPSPDAASNDADQKPTPQEEEDEFSDVIDEDPAPKRKSAPQKEKEPRAKKAKAAPKEKKEAAPSDPQQEEIKKLQGQLLKCGVRKVWGNELKKYGTDSKAKIKHLKGMLHDVGMDGRFSEQRAREVKERRELMADVEAATEMNELWGDAKQGRRTRGSRGRSMKEDSGSEDEGAAEKDDASDAEMKDGSGDEAGGFAARKRRAQADLAFLGDDSDSD